MEVNLKTWLKRLGISVGLGFISSILGDGFGTVFILSLLLFYLEDRKDLENKEGNKD